MSLMDNNILILGLQYAGYVLEVVLFVLLAKHGKLHRLTAMCLYVVGLFLTDGVARPAVLHYFGISSTQYFNFYWVTDVMLALGQFLLIGAFFRRACLREEKMWRFARLVLVFAFILVCVVSALFITRNYSQLITGFIIEFSQNLYFTCLVLNTLLFVMIQQFSIEDDELGMLVCGIGIQFAGEAACLAFLHLSLNDNFSRALLTFLGPACTLGMLSVWIYAVSKPSEPVSIRLPGKGEAALAEVLAD